MLIKQSLGRFLCKHVFIMNDRSAENNLKLNAGMSAPTESISAVCALTAVLSDRSAHLTPPIKLHQNGRIKQLFSSQQKVIYTLKSAIYNLAQTPKPLNVKT